MRLALAVILALVAPGARAGDLAERAARSWAVETSGSTVELAARGRGVLVLAIRTGPGVHVQSQAPLRVTLTSSPGLALAKARLGREDAVDPRAESPRFEVPFTAGAAGPQEVKARLDFFLCSDRWCLRQEREVAWPVTVRDAAIGGAAEGAPGSGVDPAR